MNNSTVIIEQFDNGISYKWDSDNADPTHMVSLDVTRNQDIGKELWFGNPEKANYIIHWLKSLKERYTWKPSDEQIEALESATENCAYSDYQDCLRELIGQLKKLKE